MTVAPNAYLRTRILTASPAELRLLLLDGAIRFAQATRDALERRDYEGVFANTTRCQNILLELINGLRPEQDPELCAKLSGLYTFLYTRMVSGCSQRNTASVDEVLKLLEFERETWQLLMQELARENASAQTIAELPETAPPTSMPGTASELVGAILSVRG
jgi:flagellar protein FliS